MEVHGTRFGSLNFGDEDLIHLLDGLMGFPASKRFLLFPYAEESAFYWLQSVDEPEVAFIVINPFEFFSNLDFTISDEDSARIAVEKGEDVEVFSLVNVPDGQPEAVRTNLAAPVLVNVHNRRGLQILAPDYSARQPLIPVDMRRQAKEKALREVAQQQQMMAV
ncbi:flagellar assembly protein FliW [Candidatus Magnetaquicoccus inordinatus]|uniref:flagellar assembly protein FliW n=1 Tax=Candidatus Magnetaquicoccus inordinatus TaxID=2496818 RepID=UPI00102C6287|nr:flagellar assembly protein FliW [Candidatus Magnetaquicoccus inordinatus]